MGKIYKIIIACSASLLLFMFFLLKSDTISSYIYPTKIEHIELINLPDNRLRLKVRVTTNKKCSTYLKYWISGSRDTLYSDLSSDSVTHTLNVMCTVAKTDYNFIVIAGNGVDTTSSREHHFATQSIYQATPYFDMQQVDPAIEKDLKNKYFLTQILTQPGSMVIINYKGDIVWYQPFKKGVKVTNWTSHHTVMAIVGSEKIPSSGGDELVETDLTGKEVLHWKVGKGEMDKMIHHEVRYDDDGNVYALTFDKRPWDLTKAGGAAKDTVHADGIMVFSKAGRKLWEWSVLDHLDPLKDPLILKHKKDWVHANSLFKDRDGNFLISYRDLNQIWKVEYKTGKVLWKFGEGGDFPLQKNEYFSSQHAVHRKANGEIMMLDNGTKTGISRAMTFVLDETKKTAKSTLIVPLPHDYYSTAKGDTHMILGDKVLFCLTDPRSFLITDKSGKTLWEISVGGDPYRLEEAPGFLMPKPLIK